MANGTEVQGIRPSTRPDSQAGARVAVVVVTHHSAEVIGGLVERLPAALEGVDAQVIAVDNASCDDTVKRLQQADVVDHVVTLADNWGYAAALNVGVALARDWDAVLVLNPDLRPGPGMVAALFEAARDRDVGICVPRLFDGDGTEAWSLRREPSPTRAWAEALLGGVRAGRRGWGELVVPPAQSAAETEQTCSDWATGAALLITRACWEDIGAWDESYFLYGEETDFMLRARDRGWRLVQVSTAMGVHLRGEAPQNPWLWSLLQHNRLRLLRTRRGPAATGWFRLALIVNAALRLPSPVHRAALRTLLPGGGRHPVEQAGGPPVRRGNGNGAGVGEDSGFVIGPDAEGAGAAGGSLGQRLDLRRRLPDRSRRRRVLIVVQNLPVPMDRRVWQQARALTESGIGVSVICPRGPGEPFVEEREGVNLHRYPSPPATNGRLSYVVEFGYCWVATAAWSAVIWIRRGFTVLQACNPPDTYFVLGWLWRPFGVRFVFDQHDLCPEVFRSRFGDRSSVWHRALLGLERATYRRADRVIATNDSYRSIAIRRGELDTRSVTVVRNGPDLQALQPMRPEDELRRGRSFMLCYLGVMGPQDGVDLLLHAIASLVHQRGNPDVHVALLGFGDALVPLQRLCTELGLDDWVEFTGRADTAMITRYLSTADVGLCPDPKDPFNDVSTMNKTMEYMAFGLPVVAFDLTETRVSAKDAAVYVTGNDPAAFAAAIDELLDDQAARDRMGAVGRQRIESELAWQHQRKRYVALMSELVGGERLAGEDRP